MSDARKTSGIAGDCVMKDYLTYWQGRMVQQQAHHQQLRQQARSDITRIAPLLVHEFGAIRIILFGSLVKGTFTAESDIDLAVEGILSDHYFAAMAAVNRMTPRWIDLKPLEELAPHVRQRILTTGEVIYARDNGECLA
jgi:predicted nucleotidyltransferase